MRRGGRESMLTVPIDLGHGCGVHITLAYFFFTFSMLVPGGRTLHLLPLPEQRKGEERSLDGGWMSMVAALKETYAGPSRSASERCGSLSPAKKKLYLRSPHSPAPGPHAAWTPPEEATTPSCEALAVKWRFSRFPRKGRVRRWTLGVLA